MIYLRSFVDEDWGTEECSAMVIEKLYDLCALVWCAYAVLASSVDIRCRFWSRQC